ncbi:MAG: hypothetical protein JWR67_1227 [Mucilaginibacter sp.]|nr:hypothetical protein [Mucilaginibacter sp.]
MLLCFLFGQTYAQINPDSLAYQLQRKKINNMLNDRAKKFGQYDQSLSQHTGIFGLQTKKDIRRSNDILINIVKTDNDIYKQLKILLDYRTFEQTQVQNQSKETEANNFAFMKAINKLRAQNIRLKKEAEEMAKTNQKEIHYLIIMLVLMFASILLLLRSKYVTRA